MPMIFPNLQPDVFKARTERQVNFLGFIAHHFHGIDPACVTRNRPAIGMTQAGRASFAVLSKVPLDRVMHTLSDPCRIAIIRALVEVEDGEMACNEIPLEISTATWSHHFDVLRDAGLIFLPPGRNQMPYFDTKKRTRDPFPRVA